MSDPVRQLADDAMSRLAARLGAGSVQDLTILRLQTAFVGSLRQVFALTKRIARRAAA
jgi:hypothetical protein